MDARLGILDQRPVRGKQLPGPERQCRLQRMQVIPQGVWSGIRMQSDVRRNLLENMVAGKHQLLFGQKEADVPRGMSGCDKRLEPPLFGYQRVSMTEAPIDVKGGAETFEVRQDLPMRFRLLGWQAVTQQLLLTLVVQAILDTLPDGALDLSHDNLRPPQVTN